MTKNNEHIIKLTWEEHGSEEVAKITERLNSLNKKVAEQNKEYEQLFAKRKALIREEAQQVQQWVLKHGIAVKENAAGEVNFTKAGIQQITAAHRQEAAKRRVIEFAARKEREANEAITTKFHKENLAKRTAEDKINSEVSTKFFKQKSAERITAAKREAEEIARLNKLAMSYRMGANGFMYSPLPAGHAALRQPIAPGMGPGMYSNWSPPNPPSSGGGGPGDSFGAILGKGLHSAFITLGKMYALLLSIRMLWYSIRWVGTGLLDVVKIGIQYNDILKDTQYSVAGLISSYGAIRDAQGRVLEQAERWPAALHMADKLMNDLIIKSARKTKVSTEDLIRGLQEGFSGMMMAKIPLDKMNDFVIRFAQVMTALRIPLREFPQEIRGLLSGDTNPKTSRVAARFFNEWLTEGESVKKKLRELFATGGFLDWFMGESEQLGKAGEELLNNLGGKFAQVKKLFSMAAGQETVEAYERFKNVLDKLLESFVRFDKEGKPIFDADFAANIKMIADAFASMAEKAAEATVKLIGPGGLVSTLRSFVQEFGQDSAFKGIKAFLEFIPNLQKDVAKAIWTDVVYPALEGYTKRYAQVTGQNAGEWGVDKGSPANRVQYVPTYRKRNINSYIPLEEIGPFEAAKRDVEKRSIEFWKQQLELNSKWIKIINAQWQGPLQPMQGPASFIGPTLPEGYTLDPQSKKVEDEEYERALKKYNEELSKVTRNIRALRAETEAIKEPNERLRDYYKRLAKNASDYKDKVEELTENYEKLGQAKINALSGKYKTEKAQKDEIDRIESLRKSVSDLFGEWKKGGPGYGPEVFFKTSNVVQDETKAYQEGWDKAQKYTTQQRIKAEKEAAKAYAIELRKALREHNAFADLFGDLLGNLVDGGKDWARVAAQSFNRYLKDSAGDAISFIFQKFAGVYEGTKRFETTNRDGSVTVEDRQGYYNRQGGWADSPEGAAALYINQRRGLTSGMQLGQIGLGAYANARANYNGAIGSGLMSGAMGGAAMGAKWAGTFAGLPGMAWGAIIGAIVGGLASALAKQQERDNYKFGRFSVSSNSAWGINVQNLNKQEVQSMIAEMRATFDEFWNGYLELAMKFSDFIVPQLKTIGANFQKEGSKNYLKHWQEWITGTLPREVAEMFREGLGAVAQSFGMSKKTFESLWKQFDQLDPKKAIELWTVLFDALEMFKTSMQFFGAKNYGFGGEGGKRRSVGSGHSSYSAWGIQRGVLEAEGNMSMQDNLRKADERIMAVSEKMKNMIGEQQIRAAHELASLLNERMEAEKAFFRELISMSQAATEQTKAKVHEWTVEGMKDAEGNPDYFAQAEYWEKLANDAYRRMTEAKTVKDLEKAWQDFNMYIDKVKAAQSAIGPENAEYIRKWAIESIWRGHDTYQKAIDRLGGALDEVNREIVDKVRPYVDAFLTATSEMTTGIGEGADDVVDAFTDVALAATEVTRGFQNLSNILNNLSSNSDGFENLVMNGRY